MKNYDPKQLGLFDVVPDLILDVDNLNPAVFKKASDLTDLLNMDSKPKDLYHGQYYFVHGQYVVFIVANKRKDTLLNVIDKDGNIPPDFPVNWRNVEHVRREINF